MKTLNTISTRVLKSRPSVTKPGIGTTSSLFIPFEPGERTAKCTTCESESYSQQDLPFFKLQTDKDHDNYYCGCRGWG